MFRVQESEPSGSAFVVYFVQCSSCGIPVGVLEYANSVALLQGIEQKINELAGDIQQMGYDLTSLRSELRRK